MLLELNKIPKWVKILNKAGYNTDELEKRLDSLLETCRKDELYYRKEVMPKIQKDIADWKNECSQEVIECRTRYLGQGLAEADMEFQKIRNEAKNKLADGLMIDDELLRKGENAKKKMYGYRNSLDILQGKKIGIDDEMIANAKRVPLERMIEIDSMHKAKCLWHADTKPSMHTRNNFIYCYTCGAKGTSIDVYMKLHDCDFKEAVLSLNNL